MASFELIEYVPHRCSVADDGKVTWERDTECRPIKHLPQLFWADGTPWLEANLWAHERATSGKTDLKTVNSNMRHLHKYAEWLEVEGLDWRHFPMLERDRVLIRWRKKLMEMRDKYGLLAPTTATQRMNATIHFYRYARANDFIGRDAQLWKDRQVVHRFHDAVGFERTMLFSSTDLAIPNRARHGLRLENGLTPITKAQMHELLDFTQEEGNTSPELHRILQLGFFSGARIETIADLKKGSLDNAVADPAVPGVVYIAVGPGHQPHVATKFDVQGRILVPEWLLHDLSAYVSDPRRLAREALAPQKNKDLIFLTRFGGRYAERESASGTAVGRAMVDLRRAATSAGLTFMKHFHFHMTRSTFGTWLTATLLEKGYNVKAVLTFVSDAMLHKDVETTLRYIKFVEQTPIKIEVANEFTEVFLGLSTRLGNDRA
ncbi:MAG: site-specific integrase [Gammaproteobacteria bacterium]|nr:site-specific integrase [Gammaproteobacteria bacterium]